MHTPTRTFALQVTCVWAIYAIVETALVVAAPLARHALFALGVGPASFGARMPFVSPALNAATLIVCPLAGLLLGAGLSRLVAPAGAVIASAVGIITLAAAFALNAIAVGTLFVVPIAAVVGALGVLRLGTDRPGRGAAVWRAVTHPVTLCLMLLGAAFVAQPRSLAEGAVDRAPAAGVCLAAIAGLAAGVSLVGRSRAGRLIGSRLPSGPILLAIAWCAAIALPLATARTKTSVAPSSGQGPSEPRPNIIVISLDTLRADHLSLYGYERDTSPRLREFAAGATLYRRAIASSNWTLPSHASIFTGQRPWHHGAHQAPDDRDRFSILPEDVTPLPERLRRGGYVTAGFAANFGVLIPAFGFDRGFDVYENVMLEDAFTPTPRAYLFRESLRVAAASRLAPVRADAIYGTAEHVNKRAAAFLDSAAAGPRPFFLFLNYMDAHNPYVPPPPFDRRFGVKAEGFQWSRYEQAKKGRETLSPNDLAHLTSQYDGSIAYLDDRLGQLFGTLRARHLFDEALIVLTSDHGEGLGDHGVLGHGLSLYQPLVHVPLIIKYPGTTTAAVVEAPVGDVDLLPTILEVARLPPPAAADGVRLLGPLPPDRVSVSASYTFRPGWPGATRGPVEMAFFFGSLKQILHADGRHELYDLSADPGETRDLAGARALPQVSLDAARAILAEAAADARAPAVLSPEVRDRLRALGYLK